MKKITNAQLSDYATILKTAAREHIEHLFASMGGNRSSLTISIEVIDRENENRRITIYYYDDWSDQLVERSNPASSDLNFVHLESYVAFLLNHKKDLEYYFIINASA